MIKVIYRPIRFETKNEVSANILFSHNFSLKDYIDSLKGIPGIDLENYDVNISGRMAKNLQEHVNHGDWIIISPKIKDPATIGAIFAAIATALGASPGVAAVVYGIGVAATIIGGAAMLGYSIYSALQGPRTPSFGTAGEGLDESSPTYGWDGIRTTRDVNLPVPIIYGEHKVGGNVINEYIWTDGDLNYLNSLLALCEGEIESISGIKVNDNPIANFTGVSQTTRMGTNTQTAIPNFEDLHNIIPINVQLLKNNAYTYTTIDDEVEAFEIKLQLPSGLYQQDAGSGTVLSWDVTYKVEYKLSSSGTWIDLGSTTISGKTQSTLRRIFRKDGLTSGRYDLRITRTSDDSSLSPAKQGDLYLQSIDEIKPDDLVYPNTALLGLELLATDQLSGASPNITCIVKGKKISVPQVMNGATEVVWADYYWDPATSQFKLLADGTVLSWDGTTYVTRWSANPIWCLKDLLTNTRIGLGDFITASLLDSVLFLEMSKYCEERVPDGSGSYEKRFRLDVVIDSLTGALDLINQLSATFNAFAFYSVGMVKMSIDKASTVVQMFNMGNIISGSFSQSWGSLKDKPNMIEIQFLDKNKDYEQEIVAVIDEISLAAGDPLRKKTVRLFTTSMSQALRVGRYALKVAKYIERVVSFKAGIDAVACQCGDIIDISHDVPQWGFSGRVQANSTSHLVKLDQSVTILAGKTYKVQVRFANDTIEERTVTDGAGVYTEVNVSSAFSYPPAAYDVYAFGETDIQAKPFRVISLQRDNKNEVAVTAIEYDENVYDDTAVVLPTNNYSALTRTVPLVTDVTAVEKNIILDDGTIGSVIEVYFAKPEVIDYYLNRYAKARIYVSDNAGVSWDYVGETTKELFIVTEGLLVGTTYKIAVVSVSPAGSQNAIADAPNDSVIILGKALPPSNVSNFDVSQQGDRLHFSWSPITDSDLARYVIKKGADWATGDIIAEKVDVTEFDYPVGSIGVETYMIKAVDTSGNESTSPAIDPITVTPPPEMNFAVEIDPWILGREYKLSGVAIEKLNLYNPAYARDVFCLATQDTWEDIEGSAESYDKKEADGDLNDNKIVEASGSWEQIAPYDLLTIFEFKIIVSLQSKNVTGGTITVQVASSEDNVTWSAFANVNASTNYRARYLKFKFLFATSDTNHNIWLYSGTIFINAATVKTDYGRDLAVGSSGTAVTFRGDFTSAPRITGLSIKNGIPGIVYADAVTTAGMTIHVVNTSGVGIDTAEIDWECKGS